MACSSGGGGRKKASSLPVVFCLGLLFLPASGLDVDSGDCVYLGAVVVCVYCTSAYLFIYLCPCPVFFDCLILCVSIVSLHRCRPHFLCLSFRHRWFAFGWRSMRWCFVFFFFFFFSQCHLQGSRDGESSRETKLMCRLIFLTCLFQDCTHGFFY